MLYTVEMTETIVHEITLEATSPAEAIAEANQLRTSQTQDYLIKNYIYDVESKGVSDRVFDHDHGMKEIPMELWSVKSESDKNKVKAE